MNRPLAVIDVGTNSVRFEVYEAVPGSPAKLLYRERFMPRLGAQLQQTGRIGTEAIARLTSVFQRIRDGLAGYPGALIGAVGTSALREAADREAVVGTVGSQFGIRLTIISGEDEAALTARGILANEPALSGELLFVDIGGGSTELSYAVERHVLRSLSIPLGAIRCRNDFLLQHSERSTASIEQIAALRAHTKSLLEQALPCEVFGGRVPLIIGSSGTIRTLCTLEGNTLERELSRQDVSAMAARMSRMTVEEIAALPGMERNRADIILPGALIFEEVMAHCGAAAVRATKYSLRHGLLAVCLEEAALPAAQWRLLQASP